MGKNQWWSSHIIDEVVYHVQYNKFAYMYMIVLLPPKAARIRRRRRRRIAETVPYYYNLRLYYAVALNVFVMIMQLLWMSS